MPGPAIAAGATGGAQGVTGGTIAVTKGIVTVLAPSGGNTPALGQPVQIAPITTDISGRFVLRDMDPGTYLLRASADGYAQQEYNPRPGANSDMSRRVDLSAG